MKAIVDEEKALKEENIRLQRRLIREVERREAISRQLSESESSLEIEDERHFNERYKHGSSPAPYSPSPTHRSLSPGRTCTTYLLLLITIYVCVYICCLAGFHGSMIGSGAVFVPQSPIHTRTSSFGSNPQLYIPPPTAAQAHQVNIIIIITSLSYQYLLLYYEDI